MHQLIALGLAGAGMLSLVFSFLSVALIVIGVVLTIVGLAVLFNSEKASNSAGKAKIAGSSVN